MDFAHPYLLLLLLLLPALAWLKGRFGQSSAFVYSSVDLVRPVSGMKRSHAGAWLANLRWLALALFIVALAQPRLVKGESHIKASGVDIVVAIDLSGSMASEDFEIPGGRINRIDLAKQVLSKFVDNRPNDRIGLVAFAGRAYIASPLTLDHDFLQQNLERLRLGLIEDRTAIGSALMAALNRLRDVPSKSKIIILMTDGQNNAGKVAPLTAAEVAQTLKVKVYTIGIGIRGQAPFPATDWLGRKFYQMMDVDIDEDTLKKISEKTGGRYYRADSTSMFKQIYQEIDQLEKSEVEVKKYQHYDELFSQVTLVALSLLALELVLGHTVWRKLP
ncbi:MAG TPA: VWA domain-containing protein [Verrucomicrobiae bacterium]|jgi:Ca-activated chloride channel family protein|nr:VWA domain-containing protein [Verrucomicrobiae bacterium]